MTREEAVKILKSKMDGSVDTSYEWAEAVRMAIEALKAPTKYTNTPTDTPTNAPTDLISRQDAVNEIHKYFVEEIDKTPVAKDEDGDEVYTDMPTVNSLLACNKELSKRIKALPSAYAVSRDDLIKAYEKGLQAQVVDLTENGPTGEWISEELANMICNEICYYKEVTVDADSLNDLCEGCLIKKMKYTRPTGEWIKSNLLPNGWHCSHCDSPVMTDDIDEMLFCPHCGNYNGGEEE